MSNIGEFRVGLEIKEPATIAILLIGPIGDTILTSPLLHQLHMEWPEAEITIISGPSNQHVAGLLPGVDHVRTLRSFPAGISDLLALLGKKFDLYIDPKDHRSTTSRILADLLRFRLGLFSMHHLPSLRNGIVIPPADGPHFTDSALAPLYALGIELPEERGPRLSIGMNLDDRSRPNSPPKVLINVSAGVSDRKWPLERWKMMIQSFEDTTNAPTLGLFSAPDESEETRCWAAEIGIPYHETPGFVDAIRLVWEADLVLTPDTSIVHVASVTNTPTIALFANRPKNIARFAPLSRIHQVVLPSQTEGSVQDILVDDVVSALREMLDLLKRSG